MVIPDVSQIHYMISSLYCYDYIVGWQYMLQYHMNIFMIHAAFLWVVTKIMVHYLSYTLNKQSVAMYTWISHRIPNQSRLRTLVIIFGLEYEMQGMRWGIAGFNVDVEWWATVTHWRV